MLDKRRRVPRKLFKIVFEDKSNKPEHLHSPNFSLVAIKNTGDSARVAVSVSKKVSKSAVVRNKVRRRAYSSLRSIINRIAQGIYIVTAKKGSEKIKFDELRKEIEKLFSKFVVEK